MRYKKNFQVSLLHARNYSRACVSGIKGDQWESGIFHDWTKHKLTFNAPFPSRGNFWILNPSQSICRIKLQTWIWKYRIEPLPIMRHDLEQQMEKLKEYFDLEQSRNIWKTSAAESQCLNTWRNLEKQAQQMALEFLGILYRGSNRDGFLINFQSYFLQKLTSGMWVLGTNCANTDVGGSFWVSNSHHKPHTSAMI